MLTEGHCIAHYRILRLLGEGGMGRDGCSQGPRAEATHQHATSAGIQMPPQAIMMAASPKGPAMSAREAVLVVGSVCAEVRAVVGFANDVASNQKAVAKSSE